MSLIIRFVSAMWTVMSEPSPPPSTFITGSVFDIMLDIQNYTRNCQILVVIDYANFSIANKDKTVAQIDDLFADYMDWFTQGATYVVDIVIRIVRNVYSEYNLFELYNFSDGEHYRIVQTQTILPANDMPFSDDGLIFMSMVMTRSEHTLVISDDKDFKKFATMLVLNHRTPGSSAFPLLPATTFTFASTGMQRSSWLNGDQEMLEITNLLNTIYLNIIALFPLDLTRTTFSRWMVHTSYVMEYLKSEYSPRNDDGKPNFKRDELRRMFDGVEWRYRPPRN